MVEARSSWVNGEDDPADRLDGPAVDEIEFGTKQELWGETSKRKNFLAITFPDSSTHLPAIAHFVSRILPLYAGITES